MSNSFYLGGFSPQQLMKELQGNSTTVRDLTSADLPDYNLSSDSSFKFDAPGTGIKSTQQIPLDWSNFENHTFFNSAQAKTNVAFETIFNSFPFDGTKLEIDQFLDSLTGFEKYVYDSLPKSVGYLNFDGSNYINVVDSAGAEIPEMSKDQSGAAKIDPDLSSMTIEMQLYVPPMVNDNQVILQKLSGGTDGFTLALSQSSSTSACNVNFFVTSGSYYLTASTQVEKGQFNSIAAQFNRSPGIDRLYFYLDSDLVASSSFSSYIGKINFSSSPLTIGSGSSHSVTTGYTFTPSSLLSGSIDDLRIYHSNRTSYEISSSLRDTVYPDESLKVHYRFNEPTGSYSNNSIVIDHSGNGLHSSIVNFQTSQRVPHTTSPLIYEKLSYSPVLFPDNPEVASLNSGLLLSASQYDYNNPNLITKLIPQHYLTREQDFYVLDSIEGGVGDAIDDYNSLPRKTKLGSIQLISSLLYVWAKQFDEMKCFVDHFSKIRSTDYNDEGTASDQMLPSMANYYGISLPNMFRNIDSKKFVT